MPDPVDTNNTTTQLARPLLGPTTRAVGVVLVVLLAAVAHAVALEHTVVPGEVLSSIAADHDVSVDQLSSQNGIENPDLIYAGQVLQIPGPEPATAEPTHVVSSGDTLWALAHVYQMSVAALAERNQIYDPRLLQPGQVLVVSQHDLPAQVTRPEADSGGLDISTPVRAEIHIVQAGDTPWQIAAAYGVGLQTLLEANGLDRTSIIVPGQLLTINGDRSAPGLSNIDTTDLPHDLATDAERLAMMPVFDEWSAAYGVPPELLKALAWFESGWNNELESSAGAIGIGQILPITADFVSEVLVGEDLDVADPEQNIRLSARYLKYLLNQTGDVRQAVASYYQGLTATRRHGIYPTSEFYVDGILSLRDRFD